MGCMNIVIFLLQQGANANAPTMRGEAPLHLASRANQTDIVRILLRNNSEVDARARVTTLTHFLFFFSFFFVDLPCCRDRFFCSYSFSSDSSEAVEDEGKAKYQTGLRVVTGKSFHFFQVHIHSEGILWEGC